MFPEKLKEYKIILASKSPRRQYLLRESGIDHEVRVIEDLHEDFPDGLKAAEIALFLAKHKAAAYCHEIPANTIVITADTIVWLENEVINKPGNFDEAVAMLRKLSGKMHQVFTGVCIRLGTKTVSFTDQTDVYFKELSDDEIKYYVAKYKPYDKAGAYGAQEWIGFIAIDRIEGSYFNVMGLPVNRVYCELLRIIDQ